MNCSGQYNISFGANLISTPTIKRYDENTDEYKDSPASFVEINPLDSNDRDAVWDAVQSWKSDSYGVNVANNMENIAENEVTESPDKIYAITSQNDNYSHLKPDKIEALAHAFETNKRVRLMYLQVNPDWVYSLGNPELKYVGKGIMDALKEKYNDRSIILVPAAHAVRFYEKQGFEHCNNGENAMIWNKEAEKGSEYENEYW